MKPLKLILVFAAGLALSAQAQKEQWLQYHTTSPGGRGYLDLELRTNAPPNLPLPKLSAQQPYFAYWKTPMDPAGGRWICFDRTRKSGPYDKVYIDTKGDGRLDNKPAIGTTRTDTFMAYFEPAKIVFKGEDGPVTYHLGLRFMKFEKSEPRVLASSAGYYAGEVDFGGQKRHVELVDADVNGTFNDQSPEPRDTDAIQVQDDPVRQRYLGKLLELEGKFFRLEVARDGAFVKVQPAGKVPMAKVRVPETISEFVVFGQNGQFARKPKKGELTLPVGHYRIHQWTIDRKDNKGASWELSGYGFKESAEFDASEDQACTLAVGEPVHGVIEAEQVTNAVNFRLKFLGRFDETIQFMRGTERPPGPKLMLASLDGTYRATNTFEFG